MLGERSLLRFPSRQRVIHRAVGGLEELIGALEHVGDVVAQMCVKILARGPALDKGEPSRIVGALVQRVEDAPRLGVGRLDEMLKGLLRVLLLALLGGERLRRRFPPRFAPIAR